MLRRAACRNYISGGVRDRIAPARADRARLAWSCGSVPPLARRVTEAGFHVTLLSYPTMFAPFERAVDLARRAAGQTADAPLHLVGFSMGGLVMRALAAESPPGSPRSF